MRTQLIVFGLSAVALLSAAGCDKESSPPPAPATYDVENPASAEGPRFEDPDFFLEAGAFDTCPSQGVLAPQKEHRRLALPVTVKATSKRPIPLSPLEFSLQDSDGQVFRPTLASCKPTLARRELLPGSALEFYVTFDVAEKSRDFTLSFEPFLIGRKKVNAQVKVPSKNSTP